MNEQITPAQTKDELIENYARIKNITVEQAREDPLMQGETVDDILKTLKADTIRRIEENQPKLNRKQRRALQKKTGKSASVITDTARKLNYIDLIQRLRKLNEERENEIYEDADENN